MSGDLFMDYGWIRLLYSADGDEQEIAYHLHEERWYEKDVQVFRSLIAPGDTAIDVGANIGFVTTMLAGIVGPEGRVISFEPSPIVFPKLLKTIAANRLAHVTPMNVGCGASRSRKQLHQTSRSSGNASIIGRGGDSIEIRIVPLDEVTEVWTSRVALLKIDTEGYEPHVLQGARRLIDEHRPIIYLEMGGAYVSSTFETIEWLTKAGYGTEHVRRIDWSSVGNGSDYFFLPRR